MSDEQTNTGGATGAAIEQPQVKFSVLTQYVRDLSFENLLARRGSNAPAGQPEVKLQVGLDAKRRDAPNQYDVALKINIDSKAAGSAETLFLMEMDYVGVFHIEGVPENQLHPVLMIEAPRMVFPFVRRIVHDVTRDGGFPPLNIDNIDFLQLYRQELARRTSGQAAEAQA